MGTVRLRVGYGYRGFFGLPIRLSYPLGTLTAGSDGVELTPPRLLPLVRRVVLRASEVGGPVVVDGGMFQIPLKSGGWVRVGSPRPDEVGRALTEAGIPALFDLP